MERKSAPPLAIASYDAIRRQFEVEGISIREWAEARGYKPRTVYAVIQGKLQCRYGTSHKIAVDLGIKPDPDKKRLTRERP